MSPIVLAVAILLCGTWAQASNLPPAAGCNDDLTRNIPLRPAGALRGSEFVQRLSGLTDDERESAILEQLLTGNIPGFLRHLSPVHLSGQVANGETAEVIVCVSPDYLAVGSDQDFFFVPMRLRTALTVANRFRFALPTRKLVDAIYAQATMHLRPQPLPASDTMRTTAYYWEHNELVREQRTSLSPELGALTAGDKKDLVLTNRLWSYPDRVAIYGWHRQDGSPIQPLSTVHGARYADYSHGVRLVSGTAYVNGKVVALVKLLQDPRSAGLLSDEGQIRNVVGLVNALSAVFSVRDKDLRSQARSGS